MKVDILGVKIDDVSQPEALEMIEGWFNDTGKKRYIVTPNPEFIVAAQKDKTFRNILNGADLAIPDGVGLKFSGKIKNTLPGTDLMESLIGLSAEKGFTTGFLGGKKDVAERCAECLKRKYPGLRVIFAGSGGKVDDNGLIKGEDLRVPALDLLFVAFGHVKQEKWIAANLTNVPVKVAMGVGGAFDYLSGSIPRAPVWARSLGLEWLFRLLTEPWRIKRQLALIKYLYLLFRLKIW